MEVSSTLPLPPVAFDLCHASWESDALFSGKKGLSPCLTFAFVYCRDKRARDAAGDAARDAAEIRQGSSVSLLLEKAQICQLSTYVAVLRLGKLNNPRDRDRNREREGKRESRQLRNKQADSNCLSNQ